MSGRNANYGWPATTIACADQGDAKHRFVRRIMLAAVAAVAMAALWTAPTADAAVTTAFDGVTTCTEMTGADAGRYNCSSSATGVPTWDGTTPVDVSLYLPSNEPPAGGFPVVGMYHGWGGSKITINARVRSFLSRGYAVFSQSDRGWGNSCGGTDPKRLMPVCADGYNHLMDTRYEIRDAQYLLGLLVDDGIADPARIGATGPSYGGGLSMSLAALKNRVMLENDTYVPWQSPDGTPIALAAAAPEIPWTDLAYSLQPNGATLDYVADAPYRGPNGTHRIGVLKQSFVAGLYALGAAGSNYAPPGTDPDADLTTWYASVNAGEPYDTNPLSNEVVDEITTHHSSYYIDDGIAPAPLLISNGWTDDLFPVDEALRFYNRTRTEHPSADLSLFFLDYGHQRGSNPGNQPGDVAQLVAAQDAWFDHFVKGTGAAPEEDVNTLPQTCTGSDPSGSLIDAANWAAIAPGEVRHSNAASQVIAPDGGDPAAGQAFDPISGNNACATASEANAPGTANYRVDPAPAGGFELIGSPTIVADFFIPNPGGQNSQVAARLLDVDMTSGEATLVARGLWRPKLPGLGSTTPVRQVFQLHPNRYRFAAGHVAKLELLPADQPYGRNSNGQTAVTVSNLELRVPTVESSTDLPGFVQDPADKILPAGYDLAADFQVDTDADNDGWPDDVDNCPADSNDNQMDTDDDGIGDVCDPDPTDNDVDGDGVSNADDNCPNDSNPSQVDSDGDGEGDACDPDDDEDVDGDGVDNEVDNCPNDSNPGQQDADNDGTGNVCDNDNDLDLDEDGVEDDSDNCTGTPNPGQQDTDGDGVGNACDQFNDLDFDEDGVPNTSDNCDEEWNAGQQNSDADPDGDACDADDDNDGVADTSDACRTQAAMTADGCPFVPGTVNQPATGQTQTGTQTSGKRKCKSLKTKKKRRRCRAKRKRR